MSVIREIFIGSAPAKKVAVRDAGRSGALSIKRFVVSRWRLRRTRAYGD
jgi:hypothetical protein